MYVSIIKNVFGLLDIDDDIYRRLLHETVPCLIIMYEVKLFRDFIFSNNHYIKVFRTVIDISCVTIIYVCKMLLICAYNKYAVTKIIL